MQKNRNIIKTIIKIMPVILFVLIVPLIVHPKTIEWPVNQFVWRTEQGRYIDLFSYYKGVVIIIAAVIAVLNLFVYKKSNKIKKIDKYKKLLVISAIFILVISFASKYKFTALWGYIDRAEGALVLISYLVMVFYIGEFFRKEKYLKIFIYILFSLGFILGIFGLMQLTGHDPYEMEIFKKIFFGSLDMENVNFKMGANRIFMTLFNPNYVGSFAALIFGIALNMIIRRKNIIEKIMWLGLIVLVIISLFGSYSEAGFVGITFAILATLIINYKLILKHKKYTLIVLIFIVLLSVPIYKKYDDSRYIKSIKNTFTNSNKKIDTPLESITTKANFMKIKYNDEELLFTVNIKKPYEEFYLYDENKSRLKLNYNEEKKFYFPEDVKYKGINIYFKDYNDMKGYVLKFDGRSYTFALFKNNLVYVNSIGNLTSLKPVDYTKAFEGYEHLGSGRFYIWSRTIPLLKKTWLLGYGPDNFTYYFPQTDYVGKNMKNMSMVNTVVDKPHNMYLQYAVNIGVIPLLILLAFWFMLLYELFIIVKKEELDDIYLTVAAASFSSIIGFMAVGMFNDSTVNVSSIFWGIVGLGLAVVNYNRYDKIRFKTDEK